MSVLLFPPASLRQPALMTALAAVAVAETILEITGIHAGIKWPNDLLMRGKKVCGILIEQGRGVVIGIGLNLNQTEEDFRKLELPHATSLRIQSGQSFSARQVLQTIIQSLNSHYDRLISGDLMNLEACWKQRIGLIGRHVTVEKMDGSTVKGQLLSLSFSGLHILNDEGEEVQLFPELVRHIHPRNQNELVSEEDHK